MILWDVICSKQGGFETQREVLKHAGVCRKQSPNNSFASEQHFLLLSDLSWHTAISYLLLAKKKTHAC